VIRAFLRWIVPPAGTFAPVTDDNLAFLDALDLNELYPL
jgi:hypothetical protein